MNHSSGSHKCSICYQFGHEIKKEQHNKCDICLDEICKYTHYTETHNEKCNCNEKSIKYDLTKYYKYDPINEMLINLKYVKEDDLDKLTDFIDCDFCETRVKINNNLCCSNKQCCEEIICKYCYEIIKMYDGYESDNPHRRCGY